MTKDKNIESSSIKENPHNPNLLPSDITNLPEEERVAIQGQLPASGQISGPIQWPPMFPPVRWYPIQTQWGTGPRQAWVQHLPGEASYLGLANQPSVNHPTPSLNESDPTTDFKTTNPSHKPRSLPGQGTNSYPAYPLGFLPYTFPVNSNNRPKPGDPLYTSPAVGPELRLINLHLTGPNNYTTKARDLCRVLITKDKDGFLDGAVPFPTDERN